MGSSVLGPWGHGEEVPGGAGRADQEGARAGGVSIHELARRFRVHRRTVRQPLSSAVPPVRKKPPPRPSVLEPWKPPIVRWLEADRTAPVSSVTRPGGCGSGL